MCWKAFPEAVPHSRCEKGHDEGLDTVLSMFSANRLGSLSKLLQGEEFDHRYSCAYRLAVSLKFSSLHPSNIYACLTLPSQPTQMAASVQPSDLLGAEEA